MSIQATSWVLTHSQAKLGARLALIAIANHADAQGRNSFPSIPTIAAEAHLSDRQVQNTIKTLQRIGELIVIPGGGRKGTHLFHIAGMMGGENMSPRQPAKGVKNRASGGEKSCKKDVRNFTRTFLEPSLEPEETDADASVSARATPTGEVKSNGRGTRLHAGWQPGAADCEFCAACGLDPGRIAPGFRDYWLAVAGAKGVKRDWAATWRNWCRREAERTGNAGGQRSRGDRPGYSRIAAALDRVHLPAGGQGVH